MLQDIVERMKKTDHELQARLDEIVDMQKQMIDKQDKAVDDSDWRTSKLVSLNYRH
jgi:hypothetical protein